MVESPTCQDHRYWSGAEAPAGRHAEARLLWTKDALCVRYLCNQAEPLIVNKQPQTAKKTLKLWDRDVCEIFLAPDPNVPERYLNLKRRRQVNGSISPFVTPEKRETDWEFHSGMTVAAREKDRMGGDAFALGRMDSQTTEGRALAG